MSGEDKPEQRQSSFERVQLRLANSDLPIHGQHSIAALSIQIQPPSLKNSIDTPAIENRLNSQRINTPITLNRHSDLGFSITNLHHNFSLSDSIVLLADKPDRRSRPLKIILNRTKQQAAAASNHREMRYAQIFHHSPQEAR